MCIRDRVYSLATSTFNPARIIIQEEVFQCLPASTNSHHDGISQSLCGVHGGYINKLIIRIHFAYSDMDDLLVPDSSTSNHILAEHRSLIIPSGNQFL